MSTVGPLLDDWSKHSTLDTLVGMALEQRRRETMATFDPTVFSHPALENIFWFMVTRAATFDPPPPFQIHWASVNDATPEVVEIEIERSKPLFAGRANQEVTREQIMQREQAFLDDVSTWDEVTKYGDLERLNAKVVLGRDYWTNSTRESNKGLSCWRRLCSMPSVSYSGSSSSLAGST